MAVKSNILVTGGAGYIGSHTVLELLSAGERPIVLDDLSTGFRNAVPTDVPFVQGNCGDEELVTRIMEDHAIEAVIHFAAKIVVPDSVADPLGYYGNNTANARTLLECGVRNSVKHVVFSSTAATYGDPDTKVISEDCATAPINPYGRSKLMVEWMLRDVSVAHPLTYAALRYFNVAGADPQGRTGQSSARATHLIKIAVQAALGLRQGMDVYGTDYPTPDGSCIRDYTQVTDLARAHIDALRYLRNGGESLVCNIGYAQGYSVLDVVDMVKRVSGVDFEVRLGHRRAGDPAMLVASNQRAREKLGWSPHYNDLELIVKQALKWERKLQENSNASLVPSLPYSAELMEPIDPKR